MAELTIDPATIRKALDDFVEAIRHRRRDPGSGPCGDRR